MRFALLAALILPNILLSFFILVNEYIISSGIDNPLINGLSIPLDIMYSLTRIKKDSKIFGRMRAAKRANLMSERKKHPHNPSQRIIDEEKYASKIHEMNSSETGVLYQGTFTISPGSNNPVKLKRKVLVK